MLTIDDLKTPTALPVVGAATAVALYLIYRQLLPKPIPGIPYNEGSECRILGDIPSFLEEINTGKDYAKWFAKQAKSSDSPLKQVFLNPFTKPLVLLSDPREAMDVMTKRSRDFDRPSSLADILNPVVGPSQLHLQTGPMYRMHRRLVQDTMTPHFLQTIVAPNVEIASESFIELWKIKTKLARGRPFAAQDDMSRMALDGVLAFAFGPDYPYSALKPQIELVNNMPDTETDIDVNTPLEVALADYHPSLGAALDLVWYSEKIMNSVIYSLSWQKYKYTSRFKRLMRLKADMIKDGIEKAIQKRSESNGEPRIMHAIDLMVDREARHAERQGREPDFFSSSMIGEVRNLTHTKLYMILLILIVYRHTFLSWLATTPHPPTYHGCSRFYPISNTTKPNCETSSLTLTRLRYPNAACRLLLK